MLFTPSPISSPPPPPDAPRMGAMIHFPAGNAPQAQWNAAEAAVARVRATFGPGATVRWTGLWHEIWWGPNLNLGFYRQERVLGILKRQGVNSIVDFTPHPWPGSDWDGGPTDRMWGAPKAEWFPIIAHRYLVCVLWYRSCLGWLGMDEARNAIQFGNEPAAGHPGGDDSLPRGTWSGHGLWTELNRIGPWMYGGLTVLAPAYSMLDEPAAPVELATARVPAGKDWTAPIDRRTMHFRFYKPSAPSPQAYADAYVAELARRAALVLGEPFPAGSGEKARTRAEAVWVTEGYLAEGDCPEPRAECWRRVMKKVRAGVPGVAGFFAYRFFPNSAPGEIDWTVPLAAQGPLDDETP